MDALAYLKSARESFDLIYVAPPQYKGLWKDALRLIAARSELLRPDGLVVAQIDPKEYEGLELGTLQETRQKRYGSTLLVFYARGLVHHRDTENTETDTE